MRIFSDRCGVAFKLVVGAAIAFVLLLVAIGLGVLLYVYAGASV